MAIPTIRTTVTIPIDLHESLRIQAIRERKSVGKVISERLQKRTSLVLTNERIKNDFAFFDIVAKFGKQVDLLKALREDRNRDNA